MDIDLHEAGKRVYMKQMKDLGVFANFYQKVHILSYSLRCQRITESYKVSGVSWQESQSSSRRTVTAPFTVLVIECALDKGFVCCCFTRPDGMAE